MKVSKLLRKKRFRASLGRTSTNDSELVFKPPGWWVCLTLGSDFFRIPTMQTTTATGERGFSQFQVGAEKIRKRKKNVYSEPHCSNTGHRFHQFLLFLLPRVVRLATPYSGHACAIIVLHTHYFLNFTRAETPRRMHRAKWMLSSIEYIIVCLIWMRTSRIWYHN